MILGTKGAADLLSNHLGATEVTQFPGAPGGGPGANGLFDSAGRRGIAELLVEAKKAD